MTMLGTKAQTLTLVTILLGSLCFHATPQKRERTYQLKTPRASTSTSADLPKSITTPSGLEMVLIPAGSFMMGSDHFTDEEGNDETPFHRVTIKYSFYLGKFEVTQAQYRAVMKLNPSCHTADDHPVERVMWRDAIEFTRRLTARHDGYTYRLPSEAEWEYACRAGTTTDFSFGPSLSHSQANFDSDETKPVGSFPPNAWGLYDMHGNVREWCLDAYHYSYDGAPTDGSAWTTDNKTGWRLLRGGAFFDKANEVRSPSRERLNPVICDEEIGFRVLAIRRK